MNYRQSCHSQQEIKEFPITLLLSEVEVLPITYYLLPITHYLLLIPSIGLF
ncbi:MAG: hypothetical protein ACRC2M_17695 [Planktothrix sp.]